MQGSSQRGLGLYQKVSRAKSKTLHWSKIEQSEFQYGLMSAMV